MLENPGIAIPRQAIIQGFQRLVKCTPFLSVMFNPDIEALKALNPVVQIMTSNSCLVETPLISSL